MYSFAWDTFIAKVIRYTEMYLVDPWPQGLFCLLLSVSLHFAHV
uniref:Uncharacterized protein n=1 Tax=Anguilla anguilla TaxID=7936 RepID=A0A0E9WMW9_ANGAN